MILRASKPSSLVLLMRGSLMCSVAVGLCGATYADNPPTIVNRTEFPQFAVIGRLESRRKVHVDGTSGFSKGSASLVSPCYVLTAAHVVLPDTFHVSADVDYTMDFRVGVGRSTPFLGHVAAQPDFSTMQTTKGKELLLLKLPPDKCVGSLASIGWLEPASVPLTTGQAVTAAGYPGGRPDGTFAIGYGRTGPRTADGRIGFTGSTVGGQSGGPVLTWENGTIKLLGVVSAQVGSAAAQSYQHYSPENANEVEDAVEFLNRPFVKAKLDADKAAFGRPNPAAGRLSMDHLPR